MPKGFYKLRCVGCGQLISEKDSVARCPICAEAIDIEFDDIELKKRVKKLFKKSEAISGKKYTAFYPLKNPRNATSLGEGNTPLIQLKHLGKTLKQPNLFLKNEGQNPTGVFKDRGSLVEVSKALELGAKAVVCASTGNMAASVAAYSALAGLPCFVLVPEETPLGKLAQTMGYGARVLLIRGTYADCCALSSKMAEKYGYYLAGDYAFRSEGQKSLAFEVVEQLGWKAPDIVVVPVGCGTNIAAIWKGFVDFKKVGFIKKLPKMIAVQPSGCLTVVAALKKKIKKSPLVMHPKTICSAVGIGKPLDDLKAINALRESKGAGVAVPDSVTIQAQLELGAKEAIFVEPSGALPLASIKILKKEKLIKPTETVVLVATGVGLKDPKNALAAHPTPPSVEPDMGEVDRFIKYKLYAVRSAAWHGREKKLFTRPPSIKKLEQVVKKELNANLKKSHLGEIQEAIKIFISKGKPVAKSDLQKLVENVLSDLTYEKRIMRVIDYQLAIHQKKPPKAKAVVELFGKKLKAEAEGVGPVDAVIAAIQKAMFGKSKLGEKLIDFSVRIDGDGASATTEVSMKLTDAKDNHVVATASSPDIITTSIAAFEKGYNILYWKNEKN